MRILLCILLGLAAAVSAQFQFFEQMFQGGGQQERHQHQEQQNVASNSEWYQRTYESGKPLPPQFSLS